MKNLPNALYNDSLALLTDLYQLSMGYGYWKNNRHELPAVFNLFFRKAPFGGKFAIAAGLEYVANYLDGFSFSSEDIDYLSTLRGKDNKDLFEVSFLRYLRNMKFACTVRAIPEGTVVFPFEPLIQISGPIIQCQLLETILLNIINFQTLIATKSARICLAARGDRVVEFGLRRAQGIDGGLSASRAAYIGGCIGTSNVLAGKVFGIPVIGTHAHSWVMSFDSELEAFEAYVFAMPNNCTFLVDTYDTTVGVQNAITMGLELRKRGYEMSGIRLDSGDLVTLSIQARAMLDKAGFEKASIVASNDLDEYKIQQLKDAKAAIDTWGVGTALVTGNDQSALGGVYKLGSLDGVDKIKLSNDPNKTTNPGPNRTVRFQNEDGRFLYDLICNKNYGKRYIAPHDKSEYYMPVTGAPIQLEQMIFDKGQRVIENASLVAIQKRCHDQLLQFQNIDEYQVFLDKDLYDQKMKMVSNGK